MIAAALVILLGQVTTGFLSGRVTNPSGNPAVGVRVAVVPVADRNGDELLGLDQTDEAGRYRLEVPPGRYAVLAGRLDCPTYFPRTKQRDDAKEISVTAGGTTDKVDIVAAVESLYRQSVLLDVPCNKSDGAPLMRAFLTGSTRSINGSKFIFELQGVKDRTLSFLVGQRRFSYGCTDCEFLVSEDHIGPRTTDRGILFRLNPTGEDLVLTCQAKACHVVSVSSEGVPQALQLKQNEKVTVSTLAQLAFAVVP
jgi:hypothetical protein